MIFFKFGGQPIHDAIINVVAAQMRVAGCGFHFHHAFADFQDGYIERAAAQIKYCNRFVFFLVQTIGQRGGRGLVDDAQYFQAGHLAGLFGRLSLAVIEIGGNRDHRLGHFFA